MELWLVGLLVVVAVAMLSVTLFMRRKTKKKWLAVVAVIAGLFLLAMLAYLFLAFILLNAV